MSDAPFFWTKTVEPDEFYQGRGDTVQKALAVGFGDRGDFTAVDVDETSVPANVAYDVVESYNMASADILNKDSGRLANVVRRYWDRANELFPSFVNELGPNVDPNEIESDNFIVNMLLLNSPPGPGTADTKEERYLEWVIFFAFENVLEYNSREEYESAKDARELAGLTPHQTLKLLYPAKYGSSLTLWVELKGNVVMLAGALAPQPSLLQYVATVVINAASAVADAIIPVTPTPPPPPPMESLVDYNQPEFRENLVAQLIDATVGRAVDAVVPPMPPVPTIAPQKKPLPDLPATAGLKSVQFQARQSELADRMRAPSNPVAAAIDATIGQAVDAVVPPPSSTTTVVSAPTAVASSEFEKAKARFYAAYRGQPRGRLADRNRAAKKPVVDPAKYKNPKRQDLVGLDDGTGPGVWARKTK